MKYIAPILIIGLIVGVIYLGVTKTSIQDVSIGKNTLATIFNTPSNTPLQNPLNIEFMRNQSYTGSDIKIEQTLDSGSNYNRYIASYYSDGLKEYAYLTIPNSEKPSSGYPVIIFNHGYQIPKKYTPEGNYISYMDALAKKGYILFKPDFRGNGKSEGSPGSSYFSANYAVDILNAIAAIKKFKNVDTTKIGMWGHSMGGQLTLRVSEVSPDVKASVVWGGVVGSYTDIIYNWQNKVSYKPNVEDLYLRNLGLSELLAVNGSPEKNPDFWNSIDPTENLGLISTPFQIHVGLSDNQVPSSFSKYLYTKLQKENKTVEYYDYPEANHDINQSFSVAMQRTLTFFDKYLK